MHPELIIPDFQPLPFPAPLWLLKTLLVLGFYLHVLPMNMMLGSAVLAAVFLAIGANNRAGYNFRIGKGLASALPLFTSFAVTQGIVPLLFLQLLYGPAYYTSSILMAVPWIALLVLLLTAYYCSYVITYRLFERGARNLSASLLMCFVALCLAAIAFLFSNNMTLMLSPEKWVSLYKASSNGLNLNLGEPQLIPRYLHFVLSAIAVGGLTIGAFGLHFIKNEPDYASWLIKKGSHIFAGITVLQFPIGFWFLLSLPSQMTKNFMGQDLIGTVSFVLSMVFSIIALIGTAMSAVKGESGPFKIGGSAALLTILTMVLTRHMLREYYLAGVVHMQDVPVNTQWDLLSVFIVCAIGLIAYLTWLGRLTARAFQSPSQSSV